MWCNAIGIIFLRWYDPHKYYYVIFEVIQYWLENCQLKLKEEENIRTKFLTELQRF